MNKNLDVGVLILAGRSFHNVAPYTEMISINTVKYLSWPGTGHHVLNTLYYDNELIYLRRKSYGENLM